MNYLQSKVTIKVYYIWRELSYILGSWLKYINRGFWDKKKQITKQKT